MCYSTVVGKSKRKRNITSVLSVVILAVTLYFGLTPKGYDPTNNLIQTSNHITFAPSSLALTEPGYTLPCPESPFLLEMTIQPQFQEEPHFQFLFLIHNGRDKEQLLIGQWSRQLVIMNGTDYSNSRREPKLYVTLPDGSDPVKIHIESDGKVTTVYLNEKQVSHSKKLILKIPAQNGNSRLILGNSPTGTQPWTGTLYDIKVQGKIPLLIFPEKRPFLQKNFLFWPDLKDGPRKTMAFDLFINTVGFIPLGLILPLFFLSLKDMGKRKIFLISLLSVFLISIIIETIQVWIPTRDSSSLDLLLNTLGGLTGILTGICISTRKILPNQ